MPDVTLVPEDVVSAAFDFQLAQTEEDAKFLNGLGLPEATRNEIYRRLVQNGGKWLTFITEILGYEGTLKGM